MTCQFGQSGASQHRRFDRLCTVAPLLNVDQLGQRRAREEVEVDLRAPDRGISRVIRNRWVFHDAASEEVAGPVATHHSGDVWQLSTFHRGDP